MKKLMTLCIVLTAVAFLAAPAFAEVQNVKVSGDIKVMGIARDNFDLDDDVGYSNDDQQTWYQSITRVQIDADLTDNVSTCVRLLNERDWDAETNASTDTDLDLANITLKEMFLAPLTVIIGRQELRYGNALVVGNVSQNTQNFANAITGENYSARNAFDAIRAILDYDPLVVEVFTAKFDETYSAIDDQDIYGIDLAYVLDNDATVGAYVVLSKDHDNGATAKEIYTVGARGAMAVNDALDISGEIAVQTGDYSATRDQSATAVDLAATYALDATWEPVIGLGYSHRSGEQAGASVGDYEAWLPLYEDQTKGIIADFLFDGVGGGVNSNCRIINANVTVQPMQDLTASVDYYKFILDKELAASAHPGGNTSATMVINDDLGEELDIALSYDYTEDVQLGLTAAWFDPGKAFDGGNDDGATEVVGSIAVAF